MTISYFKDIYNILSKKHPNKKIYVISDHHFFHSNIMNYTRTEFNDVDVMNEYIINKHNTVINNDDVVIFLGDFSFKKSSIKEILSRMNGYKYLLLGNHDQENLIRCYNDLGFEGIFINPVKIQDKYLSHFPLQKDKIKDVNFEALVREFNNNQGKNYHGHIHTTDIGEEPFINVTCEALDYTPLFIGYTGCIINKEDSPLIINSDCFEKILRTIKEEKNIDPLLIISDYIYSLLLEAITPYVRSCFVYGSFPLYKKYGFISHLSDLDIGFIYDENLSNNKNTEVLKTAFEAAFESAKTIDDINLSLYKRFANMRIFELLYANKTGNIYRGYFDTNIVPLDIYRDTDFITYHGSSKLESLLKYNSELIDYYRFPRYETRFLTINGDIANIILQILFQQGYVDKKAIALKKLKYIYNSQGEHDFANIPLLEDTLIRFFIRNIMFFHSTRRGKEIEYINEGYKNLDSFMNAIPNTLRLQMEEILKNPNSLFNRIYKEISLVSYKEIPQECKSLIKSMK